MFCIIVHYLFYKEVLGCFTQTSVLLDSLCVPSSSSSSPGVTDPQFVTIVRCFISNALQKRSHGGSSGNRNHNTTNHPTVSTTTTTTTEHQPTTRPPGLRRYTRRRSFAWHRTRNNYLTTASVSVGPASITGKPVPSLDCVPYNRRRLTTSWRRHRCSGPGCRGAKGVSRLC